jgi:cytochrome P450
LIVMGAAQEAGAIALAWTTIELARDPGLREAYLAAEPGSEARTAIVDEILRLRPAALAALRELTERRTVLGHDLPAGTGVLVPIPLVHLDPARFPSPSSLDPARFAGRDRPDAFMPFGGGRRSCPGEALARLELDVVIPLVLERFDLRFPRRQEHAVQRATVLPPHRGGLAFAFPRSSPGAPAGGPAATGSPSRLR